MSEHPTQAVSPGADPEQDGPTPDPDMVDPIRAAEAEFPGDDPADTVPR